VKNRAKIAAINLCNAMHKQGKNNYTSMKEGRKEGNHNKGGNHVAPHPNFQKKGKSRKWSSGITMEPFSHGTREKITTINLLWKLQQSTCSMCCSSKEKIHKQKGKKEQTKIAINWCGGWQ